jgi:periplasmic protein TonB
MRLPDRAHRASEPPRAFADVCQRHGGRGRRAIFVAASLLAQGALVGAVALATRAAVHQADLQTVIPVRFQRPSAAAPGPPPPPPAGRPKPKVAARPATVKRIVAPQAVPERVPEPEPSAPEEDDGGEEGGVPGGVVGGSGDGVVGGVPGGGAGSAGIMPARPADLAMVRERIARTLVYPPRARRMGWEGNVLLDFLLLAEGEVRDLRVARTSGHSVLDDAALVAVQRAAPFPPPGLAVRVELPVGFRLH